MPGQPPITPTPQMVITVIMDFPCQAPGKPSPKSMLQDLTPESGGKKIEPPPFSIRNCDDCEQRPWKMFLTFGDHSIGVAFLNDAYNPGVEDRNLYLDKF